MRVLPKHSLTAMLFGNVRSARPVHSQAVLIDPNHISAHLTSSRAREMRKRIAVALLSYLSFFSKPIRWSCRCRDVPKSCKYGAVTMKESKSEGSRGFSGIGAGCCLAEDEGLPSLG